MDMLKAENWQRRTNMQVWRFDRYQIWPELEDGKLKYDCCYGHISIGRPTTPHEAREFCYKHAQERIKWK